MAALTNPQQEKIARRAYEIFMENGRKPGHDLENWIKAEKEIARAETSSLPEASSHGTVRKAKHLQNPDRS